ncbi:hypothetical protein AgCh_000969 [Apium graveolens]
MDPSEIEFSELLEFGLSELDESEVEEPVALLDLLDQVGDVLFVDDPTSDGAKKFTSGGFDDDICTRSGTTTEPTEARRKPSTLCFLVCQKKRLLSLTGTHYSIKVLRLLNEQSGEERVVHLYDEWSSACFSIGWPMHDDCDFFKSTSAMTQGKQVLCTALRNTEKLYFTETRSSWHIF